MSRIVNGESVERHIITNYTFKSLEENGSVVREETAPTPAATPEPQPQQPSQPSINPEVLENLLGKIEELSNNIVTIKEDFQNQLNECKTKAQEEKQRAFEDGYQKGVQEAQSQINHIVEEKLKLLEESVKKVDSLAAELSNKISSLEKELVGVALDIAKEVIAKEVSKSSAEIALALAKSLIEDVKDAAKIEIRVNPQDANYLKEHLKNVSVVGDEAVREGGVIIVTDVGNIDAEIENRYKAIKEAVLEEK